MKILAIESSSLVASVAILEDDIITAEYTINHKITHSQTLLPMIDDICKRSETNIQDINAIAISGGPGSFTGLRIGSATAKGLGQALNIPLIHVSTLQAMAYNMYGTDKLVCPIMDARRNQTYTGVFSFEGDKLNIHKADDALSIEELIEYLNGLGKPTVFIGDGIPAFRAIIDEKATFEHVYAPAGMNRQRAASVAVLGSRLYAEGQIVSAMDHLPEYLRVSQAEREREDRLKSDNNH